MKTIKKLFFPLLIVILVYNFLLCNKLFLIYRYYIGLNNFLIESKVDQELNNYSLKQLTKIYNNKFISIFNKFHKRVENILSEKSKPTFPWQEDILIDYIPANNTTQPNNNNFWSLNTYPEYYHSKRLNLAYKDRALIKKNNDWYLYKEANKFNELKNFPPATTIIKTGTIPEKFTQLWSWPMEEKRIFGYFFDPRKWQKEYEEPLDLIFIKDNTAIFQDNYRLFAVDINKGKKLWQIKLEENQHQDNYFAFFYPHLNHSGPKLLLDDNIIFAELNRNFVCINIEDINQPQIVWKVPLGEYTLAAIPLTYNETVACLMINSRGELWLVGFNINTGKIVWNNFVGLSSANSPSSPLTYKINNIGIIASNHDVIISFDIVKGTIYWLKKYKYYKYNMVDYWPKNNKILMLMPKKKIDYDNSFIKIYAGELYIKPRESEYLYVLDPFTGKIINQVFINREKYFLVDVFKNKLVLLKKGRANYQLCLIDLFNGNILEKITLDKGEIKGVITTNNGESLLKIDKKLYHFSISESSYKINLTEYKLANWGWIKYKSKDFLLFVEDNNLVCWGNDKLNRDFKNSQQAIKKESIVNLLKIYISKGKFNYIDHKTLQDKYEITPDLIPFLYKNAKQIKNLPGAIKFFSQVYYLAKNKDLTYLDVTINLGNFLKELGLIEKKLDYIVKAEKKNYFKKEYFLEGPFLHLIPIQEQSNLKKKNEYFFALKFNQLLCVHETGDILWHREIFSNPNIHFKVGDINLDRGKGRLTSLDLEIYKKNNKIILNDKINLIVLDMNSGRYLWSMTNKMKEIEYEIGNNSHINDQLYKNYGLSKNYLENIKFHILPLENDNRIVIIHNGYLYLIDVDTGFCLRKNKLKIKPFFAIEYRDNIFLFSENKKIIKLDINLQNTEIKSLDFIKDKVWYPKIWFDDQYCILSTGEFIYLCSPDFTELDSLKVPLKDRFSLKVFNDNLYHASILRFIECFSFARGFFQLKWQKEVGEKLFYDYNQDKFLTMDIEFFDTVKEEIILLTNRRWSYELDFLNKENGNHTGKILFPMIKGILHNMSEFYLEDNNLYFLLTTTGIHDQEKENQEIFSAVKWLVNVWLCAIDLNSKEIKNIKLLYKLVSHNRDISTIIATKNYIIVAFKNNFIYGKKK